MPRRRIVFMASPAYAIPALDRLAADHDIVAVYSQPPRRSGRGMQETPQPVAAHATSLGIPTFHPAQLKDKADLDRLAGHKADLFIVVAYGLLLPQAVLDMPRFGCINGHASLLPRWRGAAPIQRAIAAGDSTTGISAMLMDAGLDTGPVLGMLDCPILADDTAGTLHDRLAALNAELLADVVGQLPAILDQARPQNDADATYAHKISPAEAEIDWHRPASELARHVRAFAPVPGAWCAGPKGRLRSLSAHVSDDHEGHAGSTGAHHRPGHYLGMTEQGGLRIACGDGILVLDRVQPAGGKPMAGRDFLNGAQLTVGQPLAPLPPAPSPEAAQP